ncbi:MAG: LON peptidase substrate-binding domain-containing protein, partial [Thermodesulfobacteriota bacterium]|nr:LON peptidase substrate-binding domain-containing protein [Thermodesulfobacteriota bacterium]
MLFNLNRSKSDASPPGGGRFHLPLLPLRDIVVFPHMVVPLFVGREKSINALEHAMNLEKSIFLSSQKEAKTDDPKEGDINPVGTIASVLQLLRLPDGTVKALVEGKRRGRVIEYMSNPDFFYVEIEEITEPEEKAAEVEALTRSVNSTFEKYAKINKKIPAEVQSTVASIKDPSRLSDTIVTHLNIKLQDKQNLLEISSPVSRLEALYELMRGEIEVLPKRTILTPGLGLPEYKTVPVKVEAPKGRSYSQSPSPSMRTVATTAAQYRFSPLRSAEIWYSPGERLGKLYFPPSS